MAFDSQQRRGLVRVPNLGRLWDTVPACHQSSYLDVFASQSRERGRIRFEVSGLSEWRRFTSAAVESSDAVV